MSPHVFALRRAGGVPPTIVFRWGPAPSFSRTGDPYRLVNDDEVAEFLQQKEQGGTDYFRYLAPEEVEEALDSAEEAADAVLAGEHDDILDLLLFAEREVYDGRGTVIGVINERRQQIIEQRRTKQAEDDSSENTVDPVDVAPETLG